MGAKDAGLMVLATCVESAYLLFMFFVYKTRYVVGKARYEHTTQQLGRLFVHDTGEYENKVCLFGKVVAVLAIVGAFVRLRMLATEPPSRGRVRAVQLMTVLWSGACAAAAFHMNLTAFVYILPLLVAEMFWVGMLERACGGDGCSS
jgi:hypothetical protein